MKKLALIDGKIADKTGKLSTQNILLANGTIVGMGYLPEEDKECETINLKGKIIIADIIDSYATIAEPGNEIRETYQSALKAALFGGINAMILTPFTTPVTDCPELIAGRMGAVANFGLSRCYPMGTITKQNNGEALSEMGLMKAAGAVAFTDSHSLKNPMLMRNALRYSAMVDSVLVIRPQDAVLSDNAVMTEGYDATTLGLKGAAAASEDIAIYRDLRLLETYGGAIHFFPITTARSVALMREAKSKGLNVTCGTAPHYLAFSADSLKNYAPAFKVNPPFVHAEDTSALIQGLRDGTIDMLASDHNPCALDEKRSDFVSARAGVSNLDHFVSSVLTLMDSQKFSMDAIINLISRHPAKRFQIKCTGLALKSQPNFSIFDLKQEVTVTPETMQSQAKHSPFTGHRFKGKCIGQVIMGNYIPLA